MVGQTMVARISIKFYIVLNSRWAVVWEENLILPVMLLDMLTEKS